MPLYYDELLLYVIIINTPFIVEEKKDKYRLFIEKKILIFFKDAVKEYIYPYKNSDREKLGNRGILLLKFESAEYANEAAE